MMPLVARCFRLFPVSILAISSLWLADAAILVNTGTPDGLMAMATRPDASGILEIESADDFVAPSPGALVTGGSFFGLLSGGATSANISQVIVEMYRIFPADSNTTRTITVPTRANSPSDVAFDSRSNSSGLTFSVSTLANSFTALNSVLNGINPSPGQRTNGEGPVTGREVQINVTFTTPFALTPGSYFFVPQVAVNGGQFYWLSAPRPIVAPGTPFTGDLQAWIRNGNLDPDWLRVGTDIVGTGTFNGAFSLNADAAAVPEPNPFVLFSCGFVTMLFYASIKRRRSQSR